MELSEMIKNLIEKRAKTWEQAKAVLDERSENGAFAVAEDAEQYERMNAEIQALDERIADLISTDKANQKSDAYREEYEKYVPREVRETQESSERQMLMDVAEGRRKFVDFDFRNIDVQPSDAGKRWQVRDLKTYASGTGGATVPTSFVRRLYEHMIEASAIRQTNVQVVTTASGENLDYPKVTVFGTAAIAGEGTGIAEADGAYGKVTLGAWKYGRLAQVSSELLTDTGVDLEGHLARDLGRSIGVASGAHFITGDGTNKPYGVITATAAQVGTSVQGTDTVIEADNLITLQYAVIEPYARNGYWLMRRATEGAVRKLKDDNGQYLWAPGLAGAPNTLLGNPIVTDPNVAAVGSGGLSVAFGDFSAYVIRDVGSLRVEASTDYAFNADMTTWRGILRTDGDLIDTTGAIKVMDTD